MTTFDRWPLGINPEMDRHAAAKGLAHWSCVNPGSNDWWVRRDGVACEPSFRGPGGYLDDLRRVDRENPPAPGVIGSSMIVVREASPAEPIGAILGELSDVTAGMLRTQGRIEALLHAPEEGPAT